MKQERFINVHHRVWCQDWIRGSVSNIESVVIVKEAALNTSGWKNPYRRSGIDKNHEDESELCFA